MIIPTDYTPVQFIVPDDKDCYSILYRWKSIYYANKDTYSAVSHLSLARTYNLIYALIRTDNLNLIKYLYTEVPLISAGNINFYKLNKNSELILKEENHIKEIITFEGTQEWFKDGKQHRDNDLPALINLYGSQEWFKDGLRHRDNGLPALVCEDGTQEWYQNGNLHRDNDLPSIIYSNGTQEWHKNNQLNRDNDLPAVTHVDGTKLWYKDGKLHRDNDLPAVIYSNGTQEWYQNGVKHDYSY